MAKKVAVKTAPSKQPVPPPTPAKSLAVVEPAHGADIADAGFGELADTDDNAIDTDGNTQYGAPQSSAAIMALLAERGLKTAHVGGTLPPAFPDVGNTGAPKSGACRLIIPLELEHIDKADGGGNEFDLLVCDVYNLKQDAVEYRAQINLSKGLQEFFMAEETDKNGKKYFAGKAENFTTGDGETFDLGWGSQVYGVTYAGQLAGKGTKAGLKLWRVDIIHGLTVG